jgi:adenine-specific DNA-methyltransferase
MDKIIDYQHSLFPDLTAEFPSTRYQGSKAKIVDWIWEQIKHLNFHSCLDAFGGTGVVAYRLKQEKKEVTYNDVLRFNYYIGLALIENDQIRLKPEEINWILKKHSDIKYPHFVQDNFQDIYFTDEENAWIDQTITNIRQFTDPYKFSLAFFALCQACIIKRPYNLFHRKNLYLRFAKVDRSFGNKTTWDKSFEYWFRYFAAEINRAVFNNDQKNKAVNFDAIDIPGEYDLAYIDTPYISKKGVSVDYLWFYHFLEGLTIYDKWDKFIDHRFKHRPLKKQPSEWTDKKRVLNAFDQLFDKYKNCILVVSYRSDGIPSEKELFSLLRRYKNNIQTTHFGQYKYVLSTNTKSKEILIIGT